MPVGHQIAMSLRTAYLALHRATEAALAEAGAGVTADQFVVLYALKGGAVHSQRALVERTGSDANTLRAMLVLLENRGYIERNPHPSDGRARSVALTDQGRQVLRSSWRAGKPVRRALAEAVGGTGRATAVESLTRIAEAMNQAQLATLNRRGKTRPAAP